MKNNKLRNTKGVSLPLITGLVSLLMVSSVAVNELIIRNLRSIQRIEASSRAYLAAEGGIEDALYELSPHFAGYQTPALDQSTARSDLFEGGITTCEPGDFCNKWAIESRSGKNTWSGKLYKNQKLILPIYYDNSDTKATNILPNKIFDYTFASTDITPLYANDIEITFKIPDADSIIQSGISLTIDNDEDGLLNQDPVGIGTPGANPSNPEDDDLDGQVDEDNNEDAVILWKLTDGGKRSLTPIKGCIEAGDPAKKGSDPCESDFAQDYSPDLYSVTLDSSQIGINEKGEQQTIQDFIEKANNSPDLGNPYPKIQFELLIVAPMEHTDSVSSKKFSIPYIEYEVKSLPTTQIPYPQFTIKSDGYYRGFKQSITSTITPKTTVPLFDFTIIQQE